MKYNMTFWESFIAYKFFLWVALNLIVKKLSQCNLLIENIIGPSVYVIQIHVSTQWTWYFPKGFKT